ncbi:hypothetical protein [Bacillus paranthracis]|uniref:hypothetical protein n=1 Tax=Bacillus paranthracis TaxID=2026186 RepID=UPI0021D29CAF|nr:hypothetical protein [Bacillus paranthracis]MCU5469603.1 hypothetical protein [Bacillus paranthracis]MDX6048352.1 hypothetical protein [Bacillus paranthracis]
MEKWSEEKVKEWMNDAETSLKEIQDYTIKISKREGEIKRYEHLKSDAECHLSNELDELKKQGWVLHDGKWRREVDKKEAINLLNSLDICDYDADGETLFYALVEVNETVIDVLKQLGMTEEEIQRETDINDQGSFFDLTKICWRYAGWFEGDGEYFSLEEPK